MLHSVDRRPDGSIALFINGDLQFDSADERIYHEALALPALAIAQLRKSSNLTALIIGGGDGLVARELFKSEAVARLDLVDYSPEIVKLAREDFRTCNDSSMHDPRLNVHIKDAWEFVSDAAAAGSLFDIIVSDLTVPEDAFGARFHSIEWYEMLFRLLGPNGVAAVNAVSPQATPQAFLSIFNSMLQAKLHPRPYHVCIPSFSGAGFGTDWGFFLAATVPIQAEEFGRAVLPVPAVTLGDADSVRRLFHLPEQLFNYQPESIPYHAGSDMLLHYFRNAEELDEESTSTMDSFAIDTSKLETPAADAGANLLPPELRTALCEYIYSSQSVTGESGESGDQSPLLARVLELMPALEQYHTPEIIADFVDNPAAFLQAIDISALVQRLLQRAAELPAQLVDELKHLSDRLSEWAGDYLTLVNLSERVVTILTLVVVVGNLMYPDAVYAKGDHDAGHHGGRYGAHDYGRAGFRADRGFDGARHNAFVHNGWGYGGYHGYWGHNWGNYGWARPWHGFYWAGYVPPVYYGGSNWPTLNTTTTNNYVDETGASYPAPTYNYSQQNPGAASFGGMNDASAPSGSSSDSGLALHATYRLADGADLLPNGSTVLPLTDKAYLMLTADGTQVVEQNSGKTILTLANDPAMLYQTAVEMKRQHHRLLNEINQVNNGGAASDGEAAARVAKMQEHADRLQTALKNLGPIPANPPSPGEAKPPVEGGVEVFAGVWMTPDGKYLAIQRANKRLAYMDGSGWYADEGKTKLHSPYPTQFKAIASGFLSKIANDSDSTKKMMLQDQAEGKQHLDLLDRELAEYQSAPNGQPDDMVDYGSRQMKRSEAIRLTKLGKVRTQQKLDELQSQITAMPQEAALAKSTLAALGNAE